MKEIIKKSFLLGLGAAYLTKHQAEKMVNDLLKRNAVTIKEGRQMITKVKTIAINESKRLRDLANQEANRINSKLSGVSKSNIEVVKKKLKSLDTELSSHGKKTLKNIMKDLSK